MNICALAALALLGQGVEIERTVQRTSIDWLGRRQEIQRKEVLLIKGSSLSLADLTFGERLIIRSDLKKVWKADPLARRYSELSFDEVVAARKAAIDELRAAQKRVSGTDDGRELEGILEGLDQFAVPPRVELKVEGLKREVTVNGDLLRVSVHVHDHLRAPGWIEALSAIGAFHPVVAEKLKELGGVPMKGTLRYVLFLDRVIERFEVTSVKTREIADAEFDLPPGLDKTPLAGFERPIERKPAKPAAFKGDFGEEAPPKQDNP
jgi:hypothetical protein